MDLTVSQSFWFPFRHVADRKRLTSLCDEQLASLCSLAAGLDAEIGSDVVAAMREAAGGGLGFTVIGLGDIFNMEAAAADTAKHGRPAMNELASVRFAQRSRTCWSGNWCGVVVSMFDAVLAGVGVEGRLKVSGLFVLADVKAPAASDASHFLKDSIDARQVAGADRVDN